MEKSDQLPLLRQGWPKLLRTINPSRASVGGALPIGREVMAAELREFEQKFAHPADPRGFWHHLSKTES
jgi:hypothetical protein